MLTGRQQEIWDFLVDYVDRHGYPPTVREIGEAVGLASPSTVHAHLANLERAGLLKRDPTKPRALELVGREPAAAPVAELPKLPLVGQLAAGGAPRAAAQRARGDAASAARCSPTRTSRTTSPCRSGSAATSSCASRAGRWSMQGSSTATFSSCSGR